MRRLWLILCSIFLPHLIQTSEETNGESTDAEATNGDDPTKAPTKTPTLLYDPKNFGGCWQTNFFMVEASIAPGGQFTQCNEKCAAVGHECYTYFLDASGDDNYICKLFLLERDKWNTLTHTLQWSSAVPMTLPDEEFRVISVNMTLYYTEEREQCVTDLETLNYCHNNAGEMLIQSDISGFIEMQGQETVDRIYCAIVPIIDNPDPKDCDIRVRGSLDDNFDTHYKSGLEFSTANPNGAKVCNHTTFHGYQNSYRCLGEDGSLPLAYTGDAASFDMCENLCVLVCQGFEYHPADQLCILYVTEEFPGSAPDGYSLISGEPGYSWKQLRRIPNYDHYDSECVIRQISEAPSRAPTHQPSGAPTKVFGRCMAELGGQIVEPSHLQKLSVTDQECSDMCYLEQNMAANCIAYDHNPRAGELNFETESRCRVYINNGRSMQAADNIPTGWTLRVFHDNVQEEQIIEQYIPEEPDNNCVVKIPEPDTIIQVVTEKCVIEAPEMVMNCLNTENNIKSPYIPVSSANLQYQYVQEPFIPNLARTEFPYFANCADQADCERWSTGQKLKYRNCSDWATVMSQRMGYEDPDNEITYRCGYAEAYINECADLYDDCGARRIEIMGRDIVALQDPTSGKYDPCVPAPYNTDYTWWMLRCPVTCGLCCNSDNDCYAEQSVHYAYTDIVNNWWLLNLGVDRWEPRWTCTDQKVCEMQCDSIQMPESDQNIAIITDFLCNEQGERCTSKSDGRFYTCRDTFTIADESNPCPAECLLLNSEDFDPASCVNNRENCWACPECREPPATFPLVRHAGWCRREEDCAKRFKGIEDYEYQATNGCVKLYTKSLIEHNYVWDCCCDSAIVLGTPGAENANITGFHPSDSLSEVLNPESASTLCVMFSFILTSILFL